MTAWVRVLVAGGAILTGPCVEAAQGDVGVFTASARGGLARSYWVEGDRGIVLIGTQLLASEAEHFVRDAEARSGKKAVMALILSPTPEQFNGTPTLQKRGIKVYTSEQIAQRIPAVFAQAKKQVAAEIKADYPASAPKPVSFGEANQKMLIAGLPLNLLVLGPAVSETHVAVSYDTQLFCGELVAGPVHPALGAGNLADWLKRLQELRLTRPRRVYAAHGEPGGMALLANQMIYLRQLMGFVAAEQPRMPPDPQALARVKDKMLEAYPAHGSADNLDPLIRAEWERQAAPQ